MMNRMKKVNAVLAAQVAIGASVILDAAISAEGGFRNRSCILSELR